MVGKKQFNDILKRYLKGKASKREVFIVDQWFRKSFSKEPEESNLELLSIRKDIWARIEAQKSSGKGKEASLTYTGFWWKAVAASLIVLIGGYWLMMSQIQQIDWITASTCIGEQRTISLPDGSIVMLNVASSIRYPADFDGESRNIALTGEAFFDVAPDVDKPFVVDTDELSTTVLGTQFNVRAYPSEKTEVSVFEGNVKVGSINSPDQEKLLSANQAASFDDNGTLLKYPANLDLAGAWRNQITYLDETSLKDLAKTVERWYGYQIHFEPKSLEHCTVSGKLKMGDLKVLLNQIKFIKEIDWEIKEENNVVFIGNDCK